MQCETDADFSGARNASMFTGYYGSPQDGQGGPIGTLLLCVANTRIPCKVEGIETQKSIQLTVVNVRKMGWAYAPWKKPTGNKAAKSGKDENTKDLFVEHAWSKNPVTMEKVLSGVRIYTFEKEGHSNKGERQEDFAVVRSGVTFRVGLKEFMYESKKNESQQVFPPDLDEIPAFSVVEVMISPSNTGGFNEGYGFHVSRIRPCSFTLYSLQNPLGLSLLPPTYEESVIRGEKDAQDYPGLRKAVDTKNTGFFGRAITGSYVVKYNEDTYRFVGPKAKPDDPDSTHDNVMDGGVYAVDIRKDVLLRFTNAAGADEEESLRISCCLLDLASCAGALDFYVTHNEYLLRADPNRSPFSGVPLIDTKSLLKFVDTAHGRETFPLPFRFPPLEEPGLRLDREGYSQDSTDGGLSCPDLALCSPFANFKVGYNLTLFDRDTPDIMSFVFLPKRASGQARHAGGLERTDYRATKKPRVDE